MAQIMTPQQVYNVKRQIILCGQFVAFTRNDVNDFNEPLDTATVVHSCNGIYHESRNGTHISISLKEAGVVQDRKVPRVLIEYTDNIQLKDKATINGTTYEVTGLEDIGQLHKFLDVSLGGDIDD